jgi:hypothetical protein
MPHPLVHVRCRSESVQGNRRGRTRASREVERCRERCWWTCGLWDGSWYSRWTECTNYVTYEDTSPSANSDRVCGKVTVCDAGQFERSPPTNVTDRHCEACTIGTFSHADVVRCQECGGLQHDHDGDPATACTLNATVFVAIVLVMTGVLMHAMATPLYRRPENRGAVKDACKSLGKVVGLLLVCGSKNFYEQRVAPLCSRIYAFCKSCWPKREPKRVAPKKYEMPDWLANGGKQLQLQPWLQPWLQPASEARPEDPDEAEPGHECLFIFGRCPGCGAWQDEGDMGAGALRHLRRRPHHLLHPPTRTTCANIPMRKAHNITLELQ